MYVQSGHSFQNMLKTHARYVSNNNAVFLIDLLLFDCQSKLHIFRPNFMFAVL